MFSRHRPLIVCGSMVFWNKGFLGLQKKKVFTVDWERIEGLNYFLSQDMSASSVSLIIGVQCSKLYAKSPQPHPSCVNPPHSQLKKSFDKAGG